jgi:hypothetical protein
MAQGQDKTDDWSILFQVIHSTDVIAGGYCVPATNRQALWSQASHSYDALGD